MKKFKKLMPYNLQFFAEGGVGNAESGQENQGGNGSEQGSGADQSGQRQNNNAMFTQDQVSAMMAREKKEGKKSILNSLGFKSEKEAQDAFKLLTALTNSQKTDNEVNKDAVDKANTEKLEAENRAKVAENKLAVLQAGVSPDMLEDVLAIASVKVTDDKDLTKVLEEMKKEEKYRMFFNSSSSNNSSDNNPGNQSTGNSFGSGTTGASNNKGDNGKSYGARLAESMNVAKTKSSYF